MEPESNCGPDRDGTAARKPVRFEDRRLQPSGRAPAAPLHNHIVAGEVWTLANSASNYCAIPLLFRRSQNWLRIGAGKLLTNSEVLEAQNTPTLCEQADRQPRGGYQPKCSSHPCSIGQVASRELHNRSARIVIIRAV